MHTSLISFSNNSWFLIGLNEYQYSSTTWSCSVCLFADRITEYNWESVQEKDFTRTCSNLQFLLFLVLKDKVTMKNICWITTLPSVWYEIWLDKTVCRLMAIVKQSRLDRIWYPTYFIWQQLMFPKGFKYKISKPFSFELVCLGSYNRRWVVIFSLDRLSYDVFAFNILLRYVISDIVSVRLMHHLRYLFRIL